MLRSLLYTRNERGLLKIDVINYLNGDLLMHGLYYVHVKQWLRYFPREQFLFINGEIDKVQTFLNLDFIIQKSHFVLNEQRGVYCIKDPLNLTKVVCMGEDKGTRHPVIGPIISNDLRAFL
jgi:hypothetical protein